MENVRCLCGKILCQASTTISPPPGREEHHTAVAIKCRHCKRFMILYVKEIGGIEYTETIQAVK